MQCLGLLLTEMLAGSLPDPVGVPRSDIFPDTVPAPAVKRIRALVNPQSEDPMGAAQWAEYARTGEPEETEPEPSADPQPDAIFYETHAGRGIPWAWLATAAGFLLLAAAVIVLWLRQSPTAAVPASPRAEAAAPAITPPPDVLTRVQVGPIQPADEAKTISRLKAMRFQPYVRREGTVLYMQVGAFANADGAKATVDQLQRAGFTVRVK
jgi:hypothetical protein